MNNQLAKQELDARQLAIISNEYHRKAKSKTIAYLFWFFLGLLGGHRFYAKDNLKGLLMLITIGGCGIWTLIDVFFIGKRIEEVNREIEQQIIQTTYEGNTKTVDNGKEPTAFLQKHLKNSLEKRKDVPGPARAHFLGATTHIPAKHMTGLPMAEGAECFLYLCPDKVIFERNETSYNLTVDKITDVLVKTDTEIQKSYVSSVGGAVAGNILFGPLGAIIGGRAKEKTSKVESHYLIFAYDKNGATDYISFDVTGKIDAYKFIDHFAKMPKARKEVFL